MKDVIRKEKLYRHNINRVWQAITDQDEITTWFIKADFKPTVGYNYTFVHEDTTINGEVLEVQPVTKLVYTWAVSGTGEVKTTVNWLLSETTEGTKLVIEHSGISNYPDEAMATTMFNNYSGGWDNCIAELEKFLKEVSHA